jgi:hypothetical protein
MPGACNFNGPFDKFATMSLIAQGPEEEAARSVRWLPLVTAIGAVTTAAPFAWNGKDFGTFLLLFALYLPLVTLVGIGLCIWAIRERTSSRARSIVASLVAMLGLIAGTFWILPAAKDDLRFLAWSLTHNDAMRASADRDSVVMDWESWGMAGMEDDAYLVSNPNDDLTRDGGAARWLRHINSSCEIVASKRMRRGIYIVTTYNCPLR